MKIEVIVLDKKVQEFKKHMNNKARRLASALAGQAGFLRKNVVIEVYLADGKRMRALNKKFLKKDKDTNVISLVMSKDFPGLVAGEVYLNPLFIKKNRQDLDLMLVHGVLHILGYDHAKKNDRIKMDKEEQRLLSLISSSETNFIV